MFGCPPAGLLVNSGLDLDHLHAGIRGTHRESPRERPGRQKLSRRATEGNHVLMLGRLRELALYRAEVLRERGFAVTVPDSKDEAVKLIRRGTFDIAVLTYTLSTETVEELATLIRENCPDCPVVAISDSGRYDRRIEPDETVVADDGPAALIAALRRVTRTN